MSRGRSAPILGAILSIGSIASHAAAGGGANNTLAVHDCSYGDVYQFNKAGCRLTLENTSAAPLAVTIVPVQPGNTVEPDKLTLQPHARANVDVHVLTDNIAGEVTWTFRIDAAGKDPQFAHAAGFVASVLDNPRPAIAFDSIDLARAPVTRSAVFASSPYSNLRIAKLLFAADFLHARIGNDGKELVTEIRPDAPWGTIDEFVKVAIDTPVQKEVWVEVTGDVQGDIGPRKNPFWLSGIPWGQRGGLTVPLIDKNGRDFKIGSVTSKDLVATYDNAPCDPPESGCRNLLISVADSQPPGLFKVQLDVAFADRANRLHVGIWGILAERPQPGQESVTPAAPKPLPLAPAAASTEATPPLRMQPEPSGDGPLLKWTIANQASVHGYQVFRGDSQGGPFVLMDPGLIQILDNGNGPVAYRWRDASAVKGRTYWYYIAVLYRSGDRRALSGPRETVAK